MKAELQFNGNGYVTGVIVGKFLIPLEDCDVTNEKLRLAIQQSEGYPIVPQVDHFAIESEANRRLQEIQRANDEIVDGVLELIMKHGRMPVAVG